MSARPHIRSGDFPAFFPDLQEVTNLTPKEKGILEDAFKFIEAFSDVPKLTDPGSDGYWQRAADVLNYTCAKWRHHPLAEKVFVGMYEYLEIKQKELSKR